MLQRLTPLDGLYMMEKVCTPLTRMSPPEDGQVVGA